MNRLIELQNTLFPPKKLKKPAQPQAKKTGPPIPEQKSYGASFDDIFNRPAYSLSETKGSTLNDEFERDDDMFVTAKDTGVPAHCTVSSASDAFTANFKLKEFDCKDAGKTRAPEALRGNLQKLMEQLEVLRADLGVPITVTSGYRTVEYNKSIGGAAQSQHLCGMAADIKVKDHTPTQVKAAIERLIKAGKMKEGGVGLYNTFVHYDIRGTHARWSGASSSSSYSDMFTKGYFDWPDKFGTGVANYDDEASKWIATCRSIVTDFSGLKKTTSYLGGYGYGGNPGADPAPDWKETDASKLKVYEAIRKELFSEGSASSINTYDNQVVTLGWGNSMLYSHGKNVIKYNMDSSADFKNAMLEVGVTIKNGEVLYVDTTAKKILTGTAALQKIRWDVKVLSRIITGLESIKQINVNNQAKILKELRIKDIPAEAYKWPAESIRLAVHLDHWLPAYLDWSAIKSSGGSVAAIVKSFVRTFKKADKDGYKGDFEFSDLANGAVYVKDFVPRLKYGDRIFIKSGDAGTIKRIDKSAFAESYKTDATYKDHIFVEIGSHVYLLP